MHRHLIPADPADWPARRPVLPACLQDRCGSGDFACPCPEACQLPESDDGALSATERVLLAIVYTTSAALMVTLLVWVLGRFFA